MASTARRAPRGTSPVPPFPLSTGVDSVTEDRDPPVRLPYASLAPLPYGAPPPIPCPSWSPSTPTSPTSPTGLPAPRRAGGGNPEHMYTSPGPLPVPRGLLAGYSPSTPPVPGTVPVTVRRAAVRPRHTPASCSTPLRERSREYGARTSPRSSPIPCGTVRSPPVRRSRSVTWTGSPSCPGRAPCAPPRLEPSPGTPERSWGTPCASRSPSSPPRRRSTPGPYGDHRPRSPASSTSPDRPPPEGPWEKILVTDSIAQGVEGPRRPRRPRGPRPPWSTRGLGA